MADSAKEKDKTKDTPALKAVIYTDGGCRNATPGATASRGTGGWGLHGYLFTDGESKVGSGCKNATPTDQGYKMGVSEKPSITLLQYIDGCGSIDGEATNQSAEILGATRAISEAIGQGVTDLLLLLDSQYVIQGVLEWSPGWIAHGWRKRDGQPVVNADLWKALLDLKTTFEESGGTLNWKWVKGHNNNLGNDLADQHATRAVITQRNGYTVDQVVYSSAKGYWNHKADRHRFFSHANWYFSTQDQSSRLSKDGRHVYYLGDPRDRDEFLGKKIANATFSVLYLKEEDPVLSCVFDAVKDMGKGLYQGLTVGHLNHLLQAQLYNDILETKDRYLVRQYTKQQLETTDSVTLTHEVKPARLAYHAVDALSALEQILMDYLDPPKDTRLRVTDITPLLYESEKTKKKTKVKLKSHVTTSLRSFDVPVKYTLDTKEDKETTLTLTLDLDLPSRNTLSAIASDDVKVSVVTWPESPHAIRFATIVETESDAGIWSGLYANLHMLASPKK